MRRDSPLRRRSDNNLADVNIGRLLDRERNSAGDRIRRHRELVAGGFELAFTSGLVTCSAKLVRV